MFRFTAISSNRKTGPIPTTMTGKASCPPTCPFKKNGCYAEAGPTNMWWNRCDMGRDEFLAKVKKIQRNQLWRHNVAGDLLNTDGQIDAGFLSDLVAANKGKRGFAYTHHLPELGDNINLIKKANAGGFTVNLSANNPAQAVEYRKMGVPVVSVVPTDQAGNFKQGGVQFIACPATYRENMTCADCQLCQKADRKCVVTFPAHGTSKRKVNEMFA